jgi:hypothetical protein
MNGKEDFYNIEMESDCFEVVQSKRLSGCTARSKWTDGKDTWNGIEDFDE